MMGRTHMGIGAVGAVAATPLLLHKTWEPMRSLLDHRWGVLPHLLVLQAVFVVASVMGSLFPDLDEPHALASQEVERFLAVPVFLMMVGSVFLLRLETSLAAWGGVLVMTLAFRTAKNLSRRIGLGVLSVVLAYLAWTHVLPVVSASAIILWCVGAMWSAHRTFTHSLLGLLLLGTGLLTIAWHTTSVDPLLHLVVVGWLVGYVLHLIADAVAGGIPVFWPISKRWGVRFVTTGGAWDYLLGGIALFGFLALALI